MIVFFENLFENVPNWGLYTRPVVSPKGQKYRIS